MSDIDLDRIRRLADLLDARFRIPGTRMRFGLDALIGLVPGVGDTVMGLVSLYIVAEAWRLGVPGGTIVRMLVNVAVDYAIGTVPIAGDLFDLFWQANRRNLGLIERALRERAPRPRGTPARR